MKESEPLISAEELEALNAEWITNNRDSVDKFYPIRIFTLVAVLFLYAIILIANPDYLAFKITANHLDTNKIASFLHFRGWMLLIAAITVLHSYSDNWNIKNVFAALFVVELVNIASDLFNIFMVYKSNVDSSIILIIAARIVILYLTWRSLANEQRLPHKEDRFKIFLAAYK